jgi:putative DNA primase/helicase
MPPFAPPRTDISDLYAQGVDLAELLLSAELIHEPDNDREDLELIRSDEGFDGAEDGEGGVVVDLLDTDSERCTDLGNARILVRLAGNDVRWCGAMPGQGWMLWDGHRWKPDTKRSVYQLTDIVSGEWRRRAPPELDAGHLVLNKEEKEAKELRKKMLAWANACESARGVRNMLEMLQARPTIAVDIDAWDKDPLVVNTPDATYNLRTAKRYTPRRSDLITRSTATSATLTDCPIWRAFLLRIMGGPRIVNPTDASLAPLTADLDAAYADPENARAVGLVAFLQRAAGYALTGDASEQCMFIAYGTGGNGKGVFLNTLKAILGGYAQGAQVATFMERKAGAIPNDLAAFAGARFILCSEPNEGAKLDEGLIKMCTGEDTITARFLNREFFDYIPIFKLWMMTNHKPMITGTDPGIWRRLRLVPFEVSIPKEERDRELPKKLVSEYSAILKWCIDGMKEWRRIGLSPPAPVAEASEFYKREMDVLADFIEDRCEVNSLLSADNAPMFASYQEWAKDNGLRPKSHKWFSQEMKRHDFEQDPNRELGRRWKGLGLRVKARAGGMFEGG